MGTVSLPQPPGPAGPSDWVKVTYSDGREVQLRMVLKDGRHGSQTPEIGPADECNVTEDQGGGAQQYYHPQILPDGTWNIDAKVRRIHVM